MTAAQNKATLKRLMEEVWSGGKLDVVDELLAPQYTIHHDPGDPWESQTLDPAGFKQRMAQSRAPFPNLHFVVEDMFAEGDRTVVRWRMRGTQTGDLPGLPASGRTIDVSSLTIYAFADGKISGHWQEMDRLTLMRQLGVPGFA